MSASPPATPRSVRGLSVGVVLLLIVLALVVLVASEIRARKSRTWVVPDVSRAHSVTLAANPTSWYRPGSMISGLTIRVTGSLDGTAELRGANWTKALSGRVDIREYHDWFERTITFDYVPSGVRSGSLVIEYTFH